jgi:hypothetical protein
VVDVGVGSLLAELILAIDLMILNDRLFVQCGNNSPQNGNVSTKMKDARHTFSEMFNSAAIAIILLGR